MENIIEEKWLLERARRSASFGEDIHLLRFATQGSLIEYSPSLKNTVAVRRSWKRGDIKNFSRRSRSRLNKKIAMLQRGNLPLFVTLTYHLEIPENFEGYKYHLHPT